MSRITLLPQTTIAAAATVTGDAKSVKTSRGLAVQAKFAYGAGGTTCKAFVQTSLDSGVTWFDIAQLAFTTAAATKVSAISTGIAPAAQAFTPGDGVLTDNTIIQGVLGDLIRVKVVSTGTYSGATHLTVTAQAV